MNATRATHLAMVTLSEAFFSPLTHYMAFHYICMQAYYHTASTGL